MVRFSKHRQHEGNRCSGNSSSLVFSNLIADRYSQDDFMGLVHIPLSDLEPDKVFEDWYVQFPTVALTAFLLRYVCLLIHPALFSSLASFHAGFL